MDVANDTKECILAAALERFNHYGYRKTTMAEIAGDCSMSAANIYRYFESKLDIGLAICFRYYAQTGKELRTVLQRPGLSASAMLEELMVEMLRSIERIIAGHPQIVEMINDLSATRKDIVTYHINFINSAIEEVLALGVARGEFGIPDVKKTSDSIRLATMAFNVPPVVGMFMRFFTPERREREVRDLVRLLVAALARR